MNRAHWSFVPVLLLAACEITVVEDKSDTGGGDTTDYTTADADTDADADADTDVDVDTDTDTDTNPPPMSILDIAVGNPDLSLLVEAATHAGLDDDLDAPGTLTLFAPTNDAFLAAGLDSKTIAAFDAVALADVLLYHLLDHPVDSTSAVDYDDSMATWTLFFDDGKAWTVNQATVTSADIPADNGTVHLVDSVLMPPSIVDVATYGGLSELVTAVGAADPAVGTLLSDPGDMTVFAPSNAAFTAASGTLAKLDQAALTSLLQYHVYAGSTDSASLPEKADSMLVNGQGYGVSAVIDAKGASINGTAIGVTDWRATNGIVHVIDDVLSPPTVVDMVAYAGLTDFDSAMRTAEGNLEEAWAQPSTFTLFTPDEQAFYDASKVISGLSPAELRLVLSYHASQSYTASDTMFQDQEIFTLLFPNTLTVDLTSGVVVEGATVTQADLHSTNGVVHVIDTVLVPPPDTTSTN